ncbi:desiccation-related PCC13-62-like [Chlorella sorokiniana]|uniref:Desiccation-related PCC13-62-like n=1 Tax=Chlorella sorokiniana TaxID=3076 RepID=A0A2P6TVQ8_CHLSO|nr:desiccation-related PCC13-62-like [Chlorella sorokiniana]|eukprot:PRW58147.1 desiccation-related PCC13-62-like [Chlorella sorokiniana]
MRSATLVAAAAALCLVALAAPACAQPPGSNPGLPPSATATGLAPQKITDMAGKRVQGDGALGLRDLQAQFNHSDKDLLSFLMNTECLEATFDSFAAFGTGMDPALFGGGPAPIGGRKAGLSPEIQVWAEEVARDEIGHVRILREALGAGKGAPGGRAQQDAPSCPLMDIDKSFEKFFKTAFNTTSVVWDPYKNDVNFVLSTFALEEIGATGDQGVTAFAATNGNITNVALAGGLAGSAGYQSAADRYILWTRRDEMVPEFNVTVAQFMDKMSALRQYFTGKLHIDQPLLMEVLNILVGGAQHGKGWFFPDGVNGRIKEPVPLNPNVPEDLLAQANAPYTIVASQGQVDPLSVQPPSGNATEMLVSQLAG